MPRQPVEFWFEFASTYSYLTAMRLPGLAERAGIEICWRPFLLGPIFAAQGWNTSPFILYPAKGRYMWRDMARRAKRYGLAFRRPDPFPQNGLLAARVATAAPDGKQRAAFSQNVYLAQFADGQDISDPAVIATCSAKAGLPDDTLETAQTDHIKQALRLTTEHAALQGIFGAPSLIVGDELFWGDDRVADALDWAGSHG